MSKKVLYEEAKVLPIAFSTSASIPAGGGVLVGNMFGVVEFDTPSTSVAVDVQVRVRGAVQITKAGTLAVGIGDTLYWDDSGKAVNKTNTTKEVGYAQSSTSNGSGETTCVLVLVPTLRNATAS